jgi:hypothetical protein
MWYRAPQQEVALLLPRFAHSPRPLTRNSMRQLLQMIFLHAKLITYMLMDERRVCSFGDTRQRSCRSRASNTSEKGASGISTSQNRKLPTHELSLRHLLPAIHVLPSCARSCLMGNALQYRSAMLAITNTGVHTNYTHKQAQSHAQQGDNN